MLIQAYNSSNESFLIKDYLSAEVYNDKIINDLYVSALTQLQSLHLENQKISELKWYNHTLGIKKYVKDSLGQIHEVYIIKKLQRTSNSYEIRIDTEYSRHRILFFPISLENRLDCACWVLSFGINKADGYQNAENVVDNLAKDQNSVYTQLNKENLRQWIEV